MRQETGHNNKIRTVLLPHIKLFLKCPDPWKRRREKLKVREPSLGRGLMLA